MSLKDEITKPEIAMTDYWKRLLKAIAIRKPQKWAETSFILLNTTKKDQEKFEKSLKKLAIKIKAGKVSKEHNWIGFLSGPEERQYLIAGYPYITKDKEVRNGIIRTILNSEQAQETRGVVIIGFDLNNGNLPYSVLAGGLETTLFDI